MEDPVKVIHRYKNLNGKVQYHIYIFIGSIVPPGVMKILTKIKNLNFFDSLLSIDTSSELHQLEELYTEFWYEKFFVSYHILSVKRDIAHDDVKKQLIISKYGSKWFESHIQKYYSRIQQKTYTYEYKIREEYEKRFISKTIEAIDPTSEIDFSTSPNVVVMKHDFGNIGKENKNVIGGSNDSNDFNDLEQFGETLKSIIYGTNQNKIVGGDIDDDFDNGDSLEDISQLLASETDNENIIPEQIQQSQPLTTPQPLSNSLSNDVNNLNKKEIEKLNNEVNSVIDSKEKNIPLEFDASDNDEIIDANIANVYKKYYVKTEYIFKNDTIKKIKSKISTSINNNSALIPWDKILPQFQYLWCEYHFNQQALQTIVGYNQTNRERQLELKENLENGTGYLENEELVVGGSSHFGYSNSFSSNKFHYYYDSDDCFCSNGNKYRLTVNGDFIDDNGNIIERSNDSILGGSNDSILGGSNNSNNNSNINTSKKNRKQKNQIDEKQARIKKVSIGLKWVIKNNLLLLSLEPNPNLSIYWNLGKNLPILKDIMNEQGKINFVDDSEKLFEYYEGFYTMNEIYMTDIFSDLGFDFSLDHKQLENFRDVYVRIYYPQISWDNFNTIGGIIKKLGREKQLLALKESERKKLSNQKNSIELGIGNSTTQQERELYSQIESTYKTLVAYNTMERFCTNEVEKINQAILLPNLKQENAKINDFYNKHFGSNNVIQTVVNTYLRPQLFLVEPVTASSSKRSKRKKKKKIVSNEPVRPYEESPESNDSQSFIETHSASIGRLKNVRLNLRRIFELFNVNEKYIFAQHKPIGKDSVPKIHEKSIQEMENGMATVMKWMNNNPYGISFKIVINDDISDEELEMKSNSNSPNKKILTIVLNEHGKIEYKITWKESNNAQLSDISQTRKHVRDLIDKINEENIHSKVELKLRNLEHEFDFALISTIMKFTLPNNAIIDHNLLSEFAISFYPYFSVVVEPGKRESKHTKRTKISKSKSNENNEENDNEEDNIVYGKSGTYLRWNRINDYDDRDRIERRIRYLIRNFTSDESILSQEISKNFNITNKTALSYIKDLKTKEPYLTTIVREKKGDDSDVGKFKDLQLPKYRPRGVVVDFQGKDPNDYKLKIMGARNKLQLIAILKTSKAFLYDFTQIFILGNVKKEPILKRLTLLTDVARRRQRIKLYVKYDDDENNLRKTATIESVKLNDTSYGQSKKWAKFCQNYGINQRRRPIEFKSVEKLIEAGYKWVPTIETPDGIINFGHYEQEFILSNGKKGISFAVKFSLKDEEDNYTEEIQNSERKSGKKRKQTHIHLNESVNGIDNDKYVYYVCNPEENGIHSWIGFQSRSGSKPCCFKLSHLQSKNPDIRRYWLTIFGVPKEEIDRVMGSENEQTEKQIDFDKTNELQIDDNQKEGYGFTEILGDDITFGPTDPITKNLWTTDSLYIIQNDELQYYRFGFLSKTLDVFFNGKLKLSRKWKDRFLLQTNGYYFRMGIGVFGNTSNSRSRIMSNEQEPSMFVRGIAIALGIPNKDLIKAMIIAISNDNGESLFSSLNDGRIRSKFRTRENYIEYIKKSNNIKFDNVIHLLTLPPVYRILCRENNSCEIINGKNKTNKSESYNGFNIMIIKKKNITIKKELESDQVTTTFKIYCKNNHFDKNRKTIVMIKDKDINNNDIFDLIVYMIKKEEEKSVDIKKTFSYNDKKSLIPIIYGWFEPSCSLNEQMLLIKEGSKSARETYDILNKLDNDDLKPSMQIIDSHWKCFSLITNNGLIVPVMPSGIVWDLQMVNSWEKYFDKKTTEKWLEYISKITPLRTNPVGYSYSINSKVNKKTKENNNGKTNGESKENNNGNKINENKIQITGIITYLGDKVPIIPEEMNSSQVKKQESKGKSFVKDNDEKKINEAIEKGTYKEMSGSKTIKDYKYKTEMYNLFRFHLASYLNTTFSSPGSVVRNEIISLLKSISKENRKENTETKRGKRKENENIDEFSYEKQKIEKKRITKLKIKNLIYSLVNPSFASLFREIVKEYLQYELEVKNSNNTNNLVDIFSHDEPLPSDFDFPNVRRLCGTYVTENDCILQKQCGWINNSGCVLKIREDMFIEFVNRVTEEIIQNSLESNEILQIGGNSVSDIVDYNTYTQREGEIVIVNNNKANLKRIFKEIFNESINDDNFSVVKPSKKLKESINQDNNVITYSLEGTKDWWLQRVASDSLSFFRALANTQYWRTHPYNNTNTRNLGYLSPSQTLFANIYRSKVIDYLNDPLKSKEVNIIANKNGITKINEYIASIMNDDFNRFTTPGFIELETFSIVANVRIIIYDSDFKIKEDYNKNNKDVLHIQFFTFSMGATIPDYIIAMYPK